jgi:hypothetical protein
MYMGVLSAELVQYAGAMSAIAALSNVRQSQLLLGGCISLLLCAPAMASQLVQLVALH